MSAISLQNKETTSSLPFPEWSDTAINSEFWEPPKVKDRPTTTFEDNQNVLLPPSFAPNVCQWKRPADIFKTEKIVVYEDSVDYSNLAEGSEHLFHSEFVRHFVSSVGIMEYMGSNKPLVVEGVTQNFTPNSENEPWRPWHHVYSLTKAGKGQKHRPLVNQTGKYIVRLFWMGCWRKITVDDKLPVDPDNNILLPSLPLPLVKEIETVSSLLPPSLASIPKDKASRITAEQKAVKEEYKEIVQIWPYILSKALLKVASLTWIDETKEIVDFDIISCLTGWIVQKMDTRGLAVEDKWEICRQFSNHYAWRDSISKAQSAVTRTRSKQSTKSKSAKSGSEEFCPFYLVGICSDMSDYEEGEVLDVAPCCSHLFLVDQTRDIPLVRPQPQPELEHWKKFRWLAWAIQKGIMDPPAYMDPIKCLKLVSVLRKETRPEYTSTEAACIKMSVEAIDEVSDEFDKIKKKVKGSSISKDQKSIKSVGSSKSRKGKGIPTLQLPDISIWCDFNNIASHIDHLHIYFKASGFEHKTTITNMAEVEASVDPRVKTKAPSVILHSQELNRFRNEPLYVFVDSLDYKFVLFNLIQPGSMDKLRKAVETPTVDLSSTDASEVEEEEEKKQNIPSVLDILRIRRQLSKTSDEKEDETVLSTVETQEPKKEVFSTGYLIVEDYNWRSEQTSKIRVFLNSLGAKSNLTNLRDGRYCLRLWIETNDQYILNILSDTALTIGNLELALNSMRIESHRLTNCCFSVSSAFGKLVQSLGTADYAASLRRFYCCLAPHTSYSKSDLDTLWSIFFEKLLNHLQQALQESDYKRTLVALRVLFLNPSLGFVAPDNNLQGQAETTAGLDTTSFTEEDILILKEIERAAVTIQAFFRGIYVRILKRSQSPADKRFTATFDCLKKVYTSCFSVEKRLSICIGFLRDLLQRSNVTNFFPWIKDLKTVVKVETFHGSSLVTFANWIPICRYLFYCRNERPVTVKICLFGEIEQSMIRVFDNDSGEEIPRHTYNCNTFKYQPNKKGYSVLCYGWTTTATSAKTQFSWRHLFVIPKQSESSLTIKDSPLEGHTLTMGYIPNVHRQIFTCHLTLQQDTLATFRLCTSYASSKVLLQCVKDRKVLAKICGRGNVILPAIFFDCDNATDTSVISVTTAASTTPEDRRSTLLLRHKRSSTKNILQSEGKKGKELRSDRVSIAPKSEGWPKMLPKEPRVLKKDTVYTVEAFVLEGSWPLTVEEWEAVTNLKKKKLIGPPMTEPLQKLTTKERNSSPVALDACDPVKPFWCLQTVFNKGDSVSVVEDATREDEIKDVKREWDDHIQDLQLDTCKMSLMSIDTLSDTERISQSPESLLNLKHNKNLLNRYSTVIFSESELFDRKIQTPEHDEREIAYRKEKIQQFMDYQEKFQMDMDLFLQEQLEKCTVLKTFISNCRTESGAMFDQIQEKRRKYVELVCPPLPPEQKGKKKK